MRLTIVPVDGVVCIDGDCRHKIDLSWVPENIHALQWYDDHGEIEFTSTIPNEKITDLGIYAKARELWEERKNKDLLRDQLIDQSIDYEYLFRASRNFKLLETDWTQLPNAPITEEQKIEWEEYRQKMRNLTDVITDRETMKAMHLDPYHPLWPTTPYPLAYESPKQPDLSFLD